MAFAAADSTPAPADGSTAPDESASNSSENNSSTNKNRPDAKKPKSKEYYINSDFDRYFQADEVKKLLAGETEFSALFRDDMTGRARGVALFLPDWGLHAANNRGIDSLRTLLPDYGWVTLSMSVPSHIEPIHVQAKIQLPSADTPADAPNVRKPGLKPYIKPSSLRIVNEDYMAAYETQIKLRLQALVTEAQNHQGYFIVIAQGSSAAAVASIYAKEELEEPEALIFINAFLPDLALNRKMNQDITVTSIPTLDIYPSVDRYGLTDNIKIRRKLAIKNFKASYRQQRLFGDISYHNQNRRLLKSVYGWLSSLGL